jgi:streptogramin lyase
MREHGIAIAAVWLTACNVQTGSVGVWDSAGSSGEATGVPGTSESPTSAGTSSATTSDATSAGSSEETAAPIFDVNSDDTPVPVDCECGNDEWSYLWVANALQGTVSKVNTETMIEESRFRTRPDGAGNPSRTSVSIDGRSVAVANRYGGLAKIFAREQFCDPMKNGTPGLQTSGGSGEVLAWNEDDCVAWYTPFPELTTQRPVAWSGRLDPQRCEDQAVWTAGCGGGFMPGYGMGGDTQVFLLDGEDGEILQSVEVADYPCANFGPYGGAIDPDGNFWLVYNGGDVAVVRADSFETQVFERPAQLQPYGIAVDRDGMVWISSYNEEAGAGRLDPMTGEWTLVTGWAGQGGVTQSLDGRIWTAYWQSEFHDDNGVAWIDPETATLGGTISVPGGTVKGVSADVFGNVYAVTGSAHKIDTSTDTIIDTYGGLSGPYTYSDMTGAGLQNVTCDPEG